MDIKDEENDIRADQSASHQGTSAQIYDEESQAPAKSTPSFARAWRRLSKTHPPFETDILLVAEDGKRYFATLHSITKDAYVFEVTETTTPKLTLKDGYWQPYYGPLGTAAK